MLMQGMNAHATGSRLLDMMSFIVRVSVGTAKFTGKTRNYTELM